MAQTMSDAIDEFNEVLSRMQARKRKPHSLILFSGIDSDDIRAAFDSLTESGDRWAYPRLSVVNPGPMEIKRIRLRPFRAKQRICKVRIPIQKDGRSS